MTMYAYLRVSTDQQGVNNQCYGLVAYAKAQELGPLQFVEDTASGRLAWRDRALGRLLTETVQAGDFVLFVEISRMARSTLQVLEMLEHCMRRRVSVHIAKQQLVLNGSMQSRTTATVLGLAAEIEREMIALRTTEALAKRRASGLPLGRPKGSRAVRLKLDGHWFRLMTDPHTHLLSTSQPCSVRLLHRAPSVSSGSAADLDAKPRPRWGWDARRGPASLPHPLWRTTDPGAWCGR